MRPIVAEKGSPWAPIYAAAAALLEARIEEHKIPIPTLFPHDNVAVVWRLPSAQQQTMYKGLLHIPQTSQVRSMPYSIGVLLFANGEGLDRLTGSGILPGDYVKFGQFAGDEEAVSRVKDAIEDAQKLGMNEEDAEKYALKTRNEETERNKVLQLREPDIHSSIDLFDRLYGKRPTMELVRAEGKDGPIHLVRPIATKTTRKGK
jgi:hypothetical protein